MRWRDVPGAARVAIVVVGVVIGVNVAITGLDSATRGADADGAESDPTSTAANGTSAWVDLLERNGIDVSTSEPGDGFDPEATAVMLGVEELSLADATQVRNFVHAGGWLIVGPDAAPWIDLVMEGPPAWTPIGTEIARPVGDAPAIDGISEVHAEGEGAWSNLGRSRALLAGDQEVIASIATLEQGTVVLLADPSIVWNGYLAEADNAGFALRIVGDGRPVEIFEPEGGGPEGLAAVPDRWKLALVGLVLAFVVGAVARGRRIGPPDPTGTPRPPPRRTFVDALGLALERTRRPGEALEPLRGHVRAELSRRAGLSPDATDAELRSAAQRLGWPDDEIDAVLTPATSSTVLACGRALARVAANRREGANL